jgi:hypothetical protein
MVLSTLTNFRDEPQNVGLVHSRRGKVLRAEPVVGLYEQQKVYHAREFRDLVQQMTEWVPDMDDSPDRVDALVHGITALYEGGGPTEIAVPSGRLGEEEALTEEQKSLEIVGIPTVSNSVYVLSIDQMLADAAGESQNMWGYQPRDTVP